MVEKKDDPFGFESMMKTWTESINTLAGGMLNMPQTQFPFQSPFVTPFQDSGSVFQEGLSSFFSSPFQNTMQNPFQWPFGWNQAGTEGNKDASADTENRKNTTKDAMSAMVTAMKNWQTISGAMVSPASISALFKGIGTMPEMLTNFAQSTMNGLGEIHKKLMESASRMGESAEAYKFDNMDENVFHLWAELYEKEFRKFLHIPQLGLAREYQEKVNDMMDKFNQFQNHLAEFFRVLSLPFQRSAVVMQEEVHALSEKGELPEDPKFYYQMWIKILEGHFMTLFQTPEYIETLSKTLSSMSCFSSSREKVLEDMLKSLPVASRSELDDLAREFSQLKRDIRALKKKKP
ncbi:PHA synthase subunit [Desulfamplus magnetovallimortis]|uniref:Poly(3-hydroxyalkanoate) polymerase subunit PhaE n=1 Tax=Desulfamplus magnetovallimortis TaxID=1246637 RepID=A0A1W1HIJ3_9BACT|nr:poly(R)-hydroxyalkanoic acid synthase subunit PhaE [Desulfamplus magnetovallimortis]SLM32337.1 PHA synthase subunit [Desulfamplus magnetovallimortis]